MDLTEVRLRCLELAEKLVPVSSADSYQYTYQSPPKEDRMARCTHMEDMRQPHDVIQHAKTLEDWVLRAEQDALDKMAD